jgi:heptosyltransferase-2
MAHTLPTTGREPRILVISLAGIGDTLFATPLVHELRANFEQARIDALVMWAGSNDVLQGNPHLNTVFQHNLIRASTSASLVFLNRLRKEKYDVSINTHPQSRVHYRIVARLINARTRLSHEYDNSGVLDKLLVNRTLKQDYNRHSIENNLALLDLIGIKPVLPRHDYELFLAPSEIEWAEKYLTSNNLTGRKLFGMHVGSGGTKNLALRRWPLDRYIELIRKVNRDWPETAILLFGGPEEERDHAQILAQTGLRSAFCPKTENLQQAAALLKKCELFLSVDTLLMHLAAAMKVPKQFVIETPTWNKPIEPYGNPFVLVKNPAVAGKNLDYYRYDGQGIRGTKPQLTRCMESVAVEAVYEKLRAASALRR